MKIKENSLTNKQLELIRMCLSQNRKINSSKYFLIIISWELTSKKTSSNNWKEKINWPKFPLIKQKLIWMNSNQFINKSLNTWPIPNLIFNKFYRKEKSSSMSSSSLLLLSMPTQNLEFTLIFVFTLYFYILSHMF